MILCVKTVIYIGVLYMGFGNLSIANCGTGYRRLQQQYSLKRRNENEPRLAVPSCHGRR